MVHQDLQEDSEKSSARRSIKKLYAILPKPRSTPGLVLLSYLAWFWSAHRKAETGFAIVSCTSYRPASVRPLGLSISHSLVLHNATPTDLIVRSFVWVNFRQGASLLRIALSFLCWNLKMILKSYTVTFSHIRVPCNRLLSKPA